MPKFLRSRGTDYLTRDENENQSRKKIKEFFIELANERGYKVEPSVKNKRNLTAWHLLDGEYIFAGEFDYKLSMAYLTTLNGWE